LKICVLIARDMMPRQNSFQEKLPMSRFIRLLPLAVASIVGPIVVLSQNSSPAKPTLTKADYDKFESFTATTVSPDGNWVAYVVNRGERGAARGRGSDTPAGELHYRAAGSTEEKTIASANAPVFTTGSRWLLYTSMPPGTGRGNNGGGPRGGRGDTETATAATPAPAGAGVGVVDLTTGATTVMQDV
jgi:hypothetical protein